MATELGSAFISVGMGTNTLAGDIKKAFGGAESSGSDAGKSAGKGFGAAFGLAAAALGAIGIGTFFKSAVSGAADLEQSMGAIGSVFKGSAGQMQEWSKQAAVDVGLSANEFNELGTLIGSQLKNGGTAMDELAPKTKDLIGVGADLASMFGGTTAEAVGALSSALKGERDPIERYGVSLSQAKIDAEAAALGFKKVGSTLSAEATQAATLSLIMKQTADAHGNFGRETDTLAHKQQVLNAQLANGKARIGTELLPVVAALTGALSAALGPAIDATVAGIHRITSAGGSLYKLLVKGDYTGAFRDAFGAEEDAPIVDSLLNIRGAVLDVWSGLSMGGADREKFAGQLSNLEAVGARFREKLDLLKMDASDLWSGFTMPPELVTKYSGQFSSMEAVGIRLAESFRNLKLDVADLWAGFTMPGDVVAKYAGQFSNMESVGISLRAVFTSIGTASAGVWSAIGPQVSALVPQLFALFQALSPTSLIFQALLPVLPQIAAAIGGVIQQILPLILSLTSQLIPIVTSLVTAILPPLTAIFGDIVTSIVPLIGIIAGALIPIIIALMPVVVNVFNTVAEVIKSVMRIVQGVIQVVTGAISGDWSRVWQGIGNVFGGIWDTIGAVISGAMKHVSAVITGGFGVIVGFFGGLGGKILGALGGIGDLLFNTGKNIIQGLIDGIGSMMGAIGRAVLSIVPEAIRGPFEQLLGIHSPSRVFMGYGVNIGQGLINGLDGMHGKIASSVEGLVTVPAIPSFGTAAYTPVGALSSGGSGATFNTTINQVDDPIGTSHAVTRRLQSLSA